jgi:hypothetical protein
MRLAAWLLAAMALALAAASPAGAAWTRQQVASSAPDYIHSATIAGNERGHAALVFSDAAGLHVAVAEPGREFGRPRRVPRSGGGGGYERLAVDENGNVLLGWTYNDESQPPRPFQRDEGCCRRIRLALLRHGSSHFEVTGTMGRPRFDSQLRHIAMINGRVGVAWDDFGGPSARFSRRGLQLGRAVRVPGAAYALAAMPLRTGPVLTYYSAAYREDATVDWSVGELRPGRSPATRTLLSRHGGYPYVGLAANASGDQAFAWSENVGNTSEFNTYGGFRKAGGVFHPRLLSHGGSYDSPRVALASTGAVLVAWHRDKRVWAAGRRPGGAFGGARAFTPAGAPYPIAVGVQPSGRGVVTWEGSSGGGHVAFRSIGGRRVGVHKFGQGLSDGAALDARGVARLALTRLSAVYAFRGSFPRR